MDARRFDSVAKLLTRRRLTRRQALAEGGAGVAAGLAATGIVGIFARDGSVPPSSTQE